MNNVSVDELAQAICSGYYVYNNPYAAGTEMYAESRNAYQIARNILEQFTVTKKVSNGTNRYTNI